MILTIVPVIGVFAALSFLLIVFWMNSGNGGKKSNA